METYCEFKETVCVCVVCVCVWKVCERESSEGEGALANGKWEEIYAKRLQDK